MTTEEDFQRQLDAHPEDWQTRLVFADWLQERDDPRAEGYRALARLGLEPYLSDLSNWSFGNFYVHGRRDVSVPPEDWYLLIVTSCTDLKYVPRRHYTPFRSRRTAEDAAALAFAKLPPERRAELLNAQPAGAA